MSAAFPQAIPRSAEVGLRAAFPISADEFAALIEHLGPFEANPVIAVGVSGGPDSMALTLLLADWAQARGGLVQALTVDHGLRAESAAEARQVGAWLASAPGVAHHILPWQGAKPASRLQEKAREARYNLMRDWCFQHGLRHLAVAHHLDDQIETHLMRAAHGSGDFGLAGMSALRELGGVRLLRPLLRVPKARLTATLRARGASWIEDPSNRDRRFERVRLRADAGDLDIAALDRRIADLGSKRAGVEAEAAALIAASVTLDPAGYASLRPEAWIAADAGLAEVALSRLLRMIGGREYLPGTDRLVDVLNWLRDSDSRDATRVRRNGWTMGGCALARRRGEVLLSRDWGAIGDRPPIAPGETLIWDRRFRVTSSADRIGSVEPLGEAGLQQVGVLGSVSLARHPMPESARKALPALWNGSELLAVPHLAVGKGLNAVLLTDLEATSCGFTVAYATTHTMYGQEM